MLHSGGLCLWEKFAGFQNFKKKTRRRRAHFFKTRVAAGICLHRISLLALREAYGNCSQQVRVQLSLCAVPANGAKGCAAGSS